MAFSTQTLLALATADERATYLKQHVFRVPFADKIERLKMLARECTQEQMEELGYPLPYFQKKFPTLAPGTGALTPAFEHARLAELPGIAERNSYLHQHLAAAAPAQRLAILDELVTVEITDAALQLYAPTLGNYQPELRLLRSII